MKPNWKKRAMMGMVMGVGLVAWGAESMVRTNSPAERQMIAYLEREAVRLDATFLEGVTNRQQWEARRPERHRQYLEMLGLWPLPERTPLQAKVTGSMERDEGFRVENLHFQSRPGLYVTGNLYLPRSIPPGQRLPAVLYVCGHSGRGRDGGKVAFQHHGMWFATHGYVCLIIDTLQLGEVPGVHHGTYRENRWWWLARGYTPAGVEAWNGIRALDYLQSRAEVDPERLGLTGISGGGAATFWIAAVDDRVKVAVPVSGMSDLEDYVGGRVVNGHCDCMFFPNTHRWSWTQIAALVAPRPVLFANSGHDPIFPMAGNDRIRARLERLYGFYTNRTESLFDIGVTPGGHSDKTELRLLAYRWLNRFLKGDDTPVTEPELAPIEGKRLRAFPDELPADQINTRVDEEFVSARADALPKNEAEFREWRNRRLAELDRLVFPSLPEPSTTALRLAAAPGSTERGELISEPGISIPWKYYPAAEEGPGSRHWLVVLGEKDTLAEKPAWLPKEVGEGGLLLIAPRGSGPVSWSDPAPYYYRRALPLLGRTVDSCALADVLAVASQVLNADPAGAWGIVGHGPAGVVGAYAALREPRLKQVVVVEPTVSHRQGPVFLNVMRVTDIPEALGLLAPRPLTVVSAPAASFQQTQALYQLAGGALTWIDASFLPAAGSPSK